MFLFKELSGDTHSKSEALLEDSSMFFGDIKSEVHVSSSQKCLSDVAMCHGSWLCNQR